MITKKGYCNMVLEDACRVYNAHTYADLIKHIPENTKMGICLQELGVLTEENNPDMYNYVNERGGIMYTYIDHSIIKTEPDNPNACQILTLREFLELLPDSL